MKKICFVCSGNTCRSPIAEQLLKKKLKDLEIKSYKVLSAGIYACNENISKHSKIVLNENGYKINSRKSKKLTNKMLNEDNIIFLTMTLEQKKIINKKNVFSIAEFIEKYDVLDPFGCDLDAYRKTFKQLDEYTSLIAEKIKKNIGDNKL